MQYQFTSYDVQALVAACFDEGYIISLEDATATIQAMEEDNYLMLEDFDEDNLDEDDLYTEETIFEDDLIHFKNYVAELGEHPKYFSTTQYLAACWSANESLDLTLYPQEMVEHIASLIKERINGHYSDKSQVAMLRFIVTMFDVDQFLYSKEDIEKVAKELIKGM